MAQIQTKAEKLAASPAFVARVRQGGSVAEIQDWLGGRTVASHATVQRAVYAIRGRVKGGKVPEAVSIAPTPEKPVAVPLRPTKGGFFRRLFKSEAEAQPLTVQEAFDRAQRAFADLPASTQEVAQESTPEVAPPTMPELIISDRQARKEKAEQSDLKAKYKYALEQIEELERRNDALLSMGGEIETIQVDANPSVEKTQVCPIIAWSDWHIEERVDRDRVNGLNEYNPEIAERRAKKLFENTVALIRKERQDAHIEEAFLWIGGDIITGYIHEELVEGNYLSPVEAVLLAQSLLTTGIDYLLNHSGVKKLRIQTSFGNHGRTTPRKRISTGYKNSYEWMMYHQIKRHYQNESAVEFNIPTSSYGYAQIYDKVIRTSHGDTFKYQGGIGGLTVPLIKSIHRLNTQRHADMNLLGHWHQLIFPTRDSAVNSSLIGFGAYAEEIGATPEPPQQLFMLADNRRGFTIRTPIFCE